MTAQRMKLLMPVHTTGAAVCTPYDSRLIGQRATLQVKLVQRARRAMIANLERQGIRSKRDQEADNFEREWMK